MITKPMLPSTPPRDIDEMETTTIKTAVITGDFGPFDSGEEEVDVDVDMDVDVDNDESKENPGGDEIPGDEFTGVKISPGGQASGSSEDLYHPNQSGEGGRGGGNFGGPTTGTPQPLLLAALVCTLWYLDGINGMRDPCICGRGCIQVAIAFLTL